MPRIVYLLFSDGAIRGGHKMALRHVEALRDLGFDAVGYIGADSKPPTWFDHRAPLEHGAPIRPDDIIVAPDDSRDALRLCSSQGLRTVILAQGIFNFAAQTFPEMDGFAPGALPPFITVGQRMTATLLRAFPHATVHVAPCFADERIFKAGPKRPAVALTLEKRPLEAWAIFHLFRKLHPDHANLEWRAIEKMHEAKVAEVFGGSSLCLSLNRLESVGMATLEAMASGCLCAGFTGVGGDEYATAENGFWVGNEYCEDAADALAAAAEIARSGGPEFRSRQEAGFETARKWSYANFREALEAAWMQIAPDARLRNGPLDPA